MKGFDYEEAFACVFVTMLLLASRHRFYRQGGLFSRPPGASELLAIGIAVGISIWIGFMTYRGVEYSDTLWWDFSYHADAPRFLRASLGVAVTALLVMAYEFLHRPSQLTDIVSPEDTEKAKAIVALSARTEANLAALGDKQFLFAGDGGGFVMYGVQGWSWVSMGDPVAPTSEATAGLVWQFKELVDLHAGVPVFYQVSRNYLPIYLDAGFSLVKLGEEAYVDLDRFTLEGGEGRKLRQSKAKAEKSGARLEIVPADAVPALLAELKSVSDAWLIDRHQREKGFSLGFWSERYLTQYDHAVVRHEDRIVAFANIWRAADHQEFSVDLMRVAPDAPQGVMDLLFISLMDLAKGEGFKWFNLGMAPLSGLPQHRLAPMWMRLAHWLFRYGDRFYKFEGLRAYKNKFHPEWRPKYLAYPGGLRLPQVLVDITTLIAVSPQRAEGGIHE
jgi:phosphatidylglycerol lysyltransferase